MYQIILFFLVTIFYLFAAYHAHLQWIIKDSINSNHGLTRLDKKILNRKIWDAEHTFFGKLGIRIVYHLTFTFSFFCFSDFSLQNIFFISWLNILGTAYYDHLLNLFHGLPFFHEDVRDNEADTDLFFNNLKIPRIIFLAFSIPFYFLVF